MFEKYVNSFEHRVSKMYAADMMLAAFWLQLAADSVTTVPSGSISFQNVFSLSKI